MSMIISLPAASSNIHSYFNLLSSHGIARNRMKSPSRRLDTSISNHRGSYIANQGMQCWGILGCGSISTTVMHAVMGDLPGATPPPTPNFPIWASWLLGTIISLILPVWKLKGGFLQKIGNEVEKVAETVEHVVEVVEDVAEAAEKISSDVADSLPEKGGPLKDVALWVEHISKEVKDDAKQALDFIHKVDELTDEVEKDFEALHHEVDGDHQQLADKETKERDEYIEQQQEETKVEGKKYEEKENRGKVENELKETEEKAR